MYQSKMLWALSDSGGWASQTWFAIRGGYNLEKTVKEAYVFFCYINSLCLTISYTENDRLVKIQAYFYPEGYW